MLLLGQRQRNFITYFMNLLQSFCLKVFLERLKYSVHTYLMQAKSANYVKYFSLLRNEFDMKVVRGGKAARVGSG